MVRDEKMENWGAGCLAVPVNILAMPWDAFVLLKLWGWFLVPLGLPPISLWWALGLSVLFWHVVPKGYPPTYDDGLKLLGRQVAVAIVCPGIALLFGWLSVLLMAA